MAVAGVTGSTNLLMRERLPEGYNAYNLLMRERMPEGYKAYWVVSLGFFLRILCASGDAPVELLVHCVPRLLHEVRLIVRLV